jgi:hypothetical protein
MPTWLAEYPNQANPPIDGRETEIRNQAVKNCSKKRFSTASLGD